MSTNKRVLLVGFVVAASLIAGCAYEGERHHHAYVAGGIDYDGYYDDYYGPITDGYWGSDNYFYYTDGPGHPYRRDEGRHVRREAADGYHNIHGHHSDAAPRGDRQR